MIDFGWRLGAIRCGEVHKERERKKQRESWGIYHNGVKHYDDLFSRVLPEGSFLRVVSPESVVLDCFAPTSFIRELNQQSVVGGGAAITLLDTRLEKERESDKTFGIAQIEANFYNPGEWLFPVNEYLTRKMKQGFDLITCAPIGGWLGSDDNKFYHAPCKKQIWWTTDTLWKLLDKGGNLFISYATQYHDELLRWIDEINSFGTMVSLGNNSQIARFTKTQDSLKTLPNF